MARLRFTTNLILVWKFILFFFSYELKKGIKKLSKKIKMIGCPRDNNKNNQILY